MATAVATCAGRALKLFLLLGAPPPENRGQNGWGDTSPAAAGQQPSGLARACGRGLVGVGLVDLETRGGPDVPRRIAK